MGRALLQRIHNPRNYVCGCDPDCWCRRTAIGRLVKWRFPALYQMVVQPRYETIVRLGARGWGLTIPKPDGRVTVNEIHGRARLETSG